MNVSILGDGLTSLTLAMMLVKQGIKVDIFLGKKTKRYNKIQTLGISKTNIEFFNKNISNINKFLWGIDNIEIYSENLKNEKILNFENKGSNLFYIVRNHNLYQHLFLNLKKNKLIKFKKKIECSNLLKSNYNLIFNCDYFNSISKKFFYRKISKNYKSFAHITTFTHKRISNNNIASQIFTKNGPLAFLPISSTETSVVYSAKGKKDLNLKNCINKYNMKYQNLKLNEINCFELKSSNLRSYYYKNIIAFGDLLHRLHPLAGQGFNMTLRDIKELQKLIEFKKKHGLELDNSICMDFEKNTKNRNFLFSSGIDFIYEFFNLENKFKDNNLSKFVKFLGRSKTTNKFFTKLADNGIII
jgi:2-octaprenyl-6-methoxyphenol hydroxylase